MKYLNEFKAFAMRGNVIDLAVGVVIGTAFTAIVNSLVGDILMPLLGIITLGVDFSQRSFLVGDTIIPYGRFIQAIIIFVMTALALFLFIKGLNRLKKEKAAEPAAPAEPSNEEKLLAEIRDLLKNKP